MAFCTTHRSSCTPRTGSAHHTTAQIGHSTVLAQQRVSMPGHAIITHLLLEAFCPLLPCACLAPGEVYADVANLACCSLCLVGSVPQPLLFLALGAEFDDTSPLRTPRHRSSSSSSRGADRRAGPWQCAWLFPSSLPLQYLFKCCKLWIHTLPSKDQWSAHDSMTGGYSSTRG